MSETCKNCGDPIGDVHPPEYKIALCLRCGIHLLASHRVIAEVKGPEAFSQIESVILHVEKKYPSIELREQVTALANRLRDDEQFQKTIEKVRKRHEDRDA